MFASLDFFSSAQVFSLEALGSRIGDDSICYGMMRPYINFFLNLRDSEGGGKSLFSGTLCFSVFLFY